MNATTLSHEQQWFIHHYLLDFNASSAARRAGYAEKSSRADADPSPDFFLKMSVFLQPAGRCHPQNLRLL